jgi:predicted naringenin-chalcone synthase
MFFAGLGTAAPQTRYQQRECWDILVASQEFARLTTRSRAILKKVLTGNNGISTRHLALDSLQQAFQMTPDALQKRFEQHAPALAAEAAFRALANAKTAAGDIDAILISTCTGYLCPGLTSYVSERLGLRPNVLALDLVGQGCVAALPNFCTGEALLASGRYARVLSICVEVCSAAFYLDEDPGVLISACLFGDGAGAAVLAAEPNGGPRLQWIASGSLLNPAEREMLRFEHANGMLRNVLRPEVPALAAHAAGSVFDRVLTGAWLARKDITGWVLHPGGRDVLKALAQRLELSEADTRWSEAVLLEYGNLSSASVYFVLERALQDGVAEGYWWMSSFGAGFSCHGALLRKG